MSELIDSTISAMALLAKLRRPTPGMKVIFRTLDAEYGISAVETEEIDGQQVLVIHSNERAD